MSDTTRRRFLHALAAAPLVTAIAACSRENREPEALSGVDRAGTLGEPDQALGQFVERPEDALAEIIKAVVAVRPQK